MVCVLFFKYSAWGILIEPIESDKEQVLIK